MRNKKFVTGALLVLAVAGAGYFAIATPSDIPYSSDYSEYETIRSNASFLSYGSLEELADASDLIVEVKVKDQSTEKINQSLVSTHSTVEVKKTYKGTSEASIIVTELGGVMDMSNFEGKENLGDGTQRKQKVVELLVEHSPVIKKNQSYLLFLTKHHDPKVGYNIAGKVQGKLKLDSESKELFSTIEPEHMKEMEKVYFVQQEFAGKKQSDFEKKLQAVLE